MNVGKFFGDGSTARSDASRVRVVAYRPLYRAAALASLALVTALAAYGGYRFGVAVAGLDQRNLQSLDTLARGSERDLERLRERLVEAELNGAVIDQAAAALRTDIAQYRDEAQALREELTFYKSLMDPASVERGLQIAQFELVPGATDDQFTYHILLTQVEARRDWVQGDVRMEVRGTQRDAAGEATQQVLSLTELANVDPYPLKYRFRYFQDLSGELALPPGFLPEAVVVTVDRRGNRAANLQRTFDWSVSG